MMGHGAESLMANSEHARDLSCMGSVGNHRVGNWERRSKSKSQTASPEESVMGETGSDELVSYFNRGNSVLVSKSRSTGGAASELGFGNSVVVSNKSANHSSSNQSHVCRHCSKVFSSGRALGGHVRVHGPSGTANGQSSSSGNVSRADQVGDFSSTDIWVKKPKAPTSRSNGNSNWVLGDSIEEEEEEEEEDEEQEDYKVVKTMDMDVEKEEELRNQKMVSLYTLRRNPKRSRRLTDEDFSMDLSARNTGSSRNCVQCGKEFPSSKALFGHMRCHPERDWRGIQPPDGNSNASEDHDDEEENQNDISDGAIVLAPGSGLSPICWQSSQGSEDLEEKEEEEEETASDNESDRESMKMGKTTYEQPLVSSSLPTWSVTAKRGRRRPIRSTQPQEEEAEEEEKEEEEGKDAKELEDDRDTAHFLVMLASAASNTNNIKVNGRVERQMTVESVYYSKKEKRESQVSSKDLEAGDEDLGWKDKKTSKKRRTDKTRRDESLSKELGAGQGKYKCSTCKKLFNSHQALGGHRASHRKVKGCFAINNVNDEGEEVTEEEITEEGSTLLRIEYHHPAGSEDNMMHRSPARQEEKEKVHLSQLTIQQQIPEPVTPIRKKAKGHECSICHKVFPSGQALGGHKRCHWTGDRVTEAANSVISIEKQPPIEKRPPKLLRGQARKLKEPPLFDLNQPPPVEEDDLEAAYGMMEVVPACAQNLNEKVKMLEAVANAGFRYVQCNMCGCLCTSMEALRTHQISHALMPPS